LSRPRQALPSILWNHCHRSVTNWPGFSQILEALEVDFIDESEVLTPADETYHINKKNFKVCGFKFFGGEETHRKGTKLCFSLSTGAFCLWLSEPG